LDGPLRDSKSRRAQAGPKGAGKDMTSQREVQTQVWREKHTQKRRKKYFEVAYRAKRERTITEAGRSEEEREHASPSPGCCKLGPITSNSGAPGPLWGGGGGEYPVGICRVCEPRSLLDSELSPGGGTGRVTCIPSRHHEGEGSHIPELCELPRRH